MKTHLIFGAESASPGVAVQGSAARNLDGCGVQAIVIEEKGKGDAEFTRCVMQGKSRLGSRNKRPRL